MKLIVTGGAGFIGSNFIRYFLDSGSDVSVINVDKLTYAGNLDNLTDVSGDNRYSFVKGDIANIVEMRKVFEQFEPDAVINFAAESHVDRSIDSAEIFIQTNVLGTHRLLEAARRIDAIGPGVHGYGTNAGERHVLWRWCTNGV